LLSIELPRMNGFSVCNRIKKDPNLKDVPLIIMSSESSDETFEQHKKLRTRAEDYVHKPIAFGELLQHIQAFITLGAAPRPDGDSAAIVIDDEIEVGSTDYMIEDDGTQIAPRPMMQAQPPHAAQGTQRGMETVDADVDAFADAAFGRLTGSEPPGAGAATPEARPIHNGAPDSNTVPAAARRPTSPPQARQASVRPPSGVDVAEYEKVREELVRTRARAGALEAEVGEARNEVEKWRLEAGEADRLKREVEELKSKLAHGAPKTGGISSREFLDLREALNKKDKEILTLKEASSRRDKEHVESQDKMLALERAKSDLDEKTLALEREVAEMRDKLDALTADKDLAKKAAEDFKARLEKSRAESEAKDRQLSELRSKHAEDIASSEAKLQALQRETEQTLANERAEHARTLEQAEERRSLDLEQAKKDGEASLQETREQLERDRQEALASQAAQLKQEHDGKMAALHRAHQQELEKARGEAEKAASEAQAAHDSELAAARKAGADEVARVRAEGESEVERVRSEGESEAARLRAQGESEVAKARSEGESEVARVRGELEKQAAEAQAALVAAHAEKVAALENDRDARLAALESRTSRELAELGDKLAKADMDLSATRGELAEVREAKQAAEAASEAAMADLRGRLADVTGARDELDRKYTVATDRIASLEAELASTRLDLGQTKQQLGIESARASKALAKWEADRQSLDRAKDAMAVALAQIEEAEARAVE
jgi:hypothetical protein